MKLLNRTKCPDEILEKLVRRSAKAFRQGTGLPLHLDRYSCHYDEDFDDFGVVVQFTQRKSRSFPSGACYEEYMPRVNGEIHRTYGGWMRIGLPAPFEFAKPLNRAEKLWKVLLHEWGHISDFQRRSPLMMNDKIPFSSDKVKIGQRRPKWEERPEEIRAEEYKNKAIKKDDGGDDLLRWAIWYDDQS